MKKHISKFKIITLLSAVLALFPAVSFAAKLYFEPSSGQYYQGDNFIVALRINLDSDECVNTVKANIKFPQDILKTIEFSRGNSILSLWIKNPEISQDSGQISFIGGIPGGFCGQLPGDSGKSNLLGKIIFQVKEIEPESFSDRVAAQVFFSDDTQVLLNDGLGTPAKNDNDNAEFEILSGIPKTPRKEWQQELGEDATPPEQFEIKLFKNNGKYFIAFSTDDKETGIDYYEVKEGANNWKKADSPYLLTNQILTSIIQVKAVDKAGNYQFAEYSPAKENIFYWIIVSVLALGGMIWWLAEKNIKA